MAGRYTRLCPATVKIGRPRLTLPWSWTTTQPHEPQVPASNPVHAPAQPCGPPAPIGRLVARRLSRAQARMKSNFAILTRSGSLLPRHQHKAQAIAPCHAMHACSHPEKKVRKGGSLPKDASVRRTEYATVKTCTRAQPAARRGAVRRGPLARATHTCIHVVQCLSSSRVLLPRVRRRSPMLCP